MLEALRRFRVCRARQVVTALLIWCTEPAVQVVTRSWAHSAGAWKSGDLRLVLKEGIGRPMIDPLALPSTVRKGYRRLGTAVWHTDNCHAVQRPRDPGARSADPLPPGQAAHA